MSGPICGTAAPGSFTQVRLRGAIENLIDVVGLEAQRLIDALSGALFARGCFPTRYSTAWHSKRSARLVRPFWSAAN